MARGSHVWVSHILTAGSVSLISAANQRPFGLMTAGAASVGVATVLPVFKPIARPLAKTMRLSDA